MEKISEDINLLFDPGKPGKLAGSEYVTKKHTYAFNDDGTLVTNRDGYSGSSVITAGGVTKKFITDLQMEFDLRESQEAKGKLPMGTIEGELSLRGSAPRTGSYLVIGINTGTDKEPVYKCLFSSAITEVRKKP